LRTIIQYCKTTYFESRTRELFIADSYFRYPGPHSWDCLTRSTLPFIHGNLWHEHSAPSRLWNIPGSNSTLFTFVFCIWRQNSRKYPEWKRQLIKTFSGYSDSSPNTDSVSLLHLSIKLHSRSQSRNVFYKQQLTWEEDQVTLAILCQMRPPRFPFMIFPKIIYHSRTRSISSYWIQGLEFASGVDSSMRLPDLSMDFMSLTTQTHFSRTTRRQLFWWSSYNGPARKGPSQALDYIQRDQDRAIKDNWNLMRNSQYHEKSTEILHKTFRSKSIPTISWQNWDVSAKTMCLKTIHRNNPVNEKSALSRHSVAFTDMARSDVRLVIIMRWGLCFSPDSMDEVKKLNIRIQILSDLQRMFKAIHWLHSKIRSGCDIFSTRYFKS
jgi:hypothetical protein